MEQVYLKKTGIISAILLVCIKNWVRQSRLSAINRGKSPIP